MRQRDRVVRQSTFGLIVIDGSAGKENTQVSGREQMSEASPPPTTMEMKQREKSHKLLGKIGLHYFPVKPISF